MKINWKVRIKNKTFWLTAIPAVFLVVQAVAATCGWVVDLDGLQQDLLGVVNAVFALLVVLGVVVDPTTDGAGDSEQALAYSEPKQDYLNAADLEDELIDEDAEIGIEENIETVEETKE